MLWKETETFLLILLFSFSPPIRRNDALKGDGNAFGDSAIAVNDKEIRRNDALKGDGNTRTNFIFTIIYCYK